MKLPILQRYLGNILALVAGGSLPLAFSPFSFFPLTILSLATLFLLWQYSSPSQAFWRGLFYGLGMFGVGISWVNHSFYQFGEMPLVGAFVLTAAFVLLMALYPALLGGLLNRFPVKNQVLRIIIILPASWTLVEWLRGWLFTGFPWLSIGYSQIDSPLNGFAPLLGVYGVSWVTALTASFIVYGYNKQKIWLMLLLISVLWSSGWLLSQITWTQPVAKPIKVALVQGNIPQDFKWSTDFQLPTIERYFTLSEQHHDVDLIIWPESAIPLFYHQVPEVLDYLNVERQNYHTDFLIGIPVMSEDQQRYFNSVMSISAHPSFYHKRHLVPFGEYIPFQTLLGNLLKLLNVPMSEFSAGKAEQPNLYAAKQTIGISICYEDAFGELIRSSLPSATLLVNVSNDAWFGDSIAPHQHLEIARMRALESSRYLLRATNTGISAIINAQGKIISQAPQFKITTLQGIAQPQQGLTPYMRFGNYLIILFLSSLLIGNYLWIYLKDNHNSSSN